MEKPVLFHYYCTTFTIEGDRPIKGPLGPIHGFVESDERGRAMHAGEVARKAAWVKFTAVNADCPTLKSPRSCYAVIRESSEYGFCSVTSKSDFQL